MKTKFAKPVQQFMHGQGLGGLLLKIEKHRALLKIIQEALPENIGRRCVDCLAKEEGRLIVFTDSQAIAAQLRFYAPVIAERLQINGYDYHNIVLRISQSSAQTAALKQKHPPISDTVVETLKRLKESLKPTP